MCRAVVLMGIALAMSPLSEAQSKKSEEKPKRGHSSLYKKFDPMSLKEKCEPHFKPFRGNGARIDVEFTHLPDWFKLYDAEGKSSEDDIKALLGGLKKHFAELAKTSGVEVLHEPKDSIIERPIGLLQAMYYGQKIRLGSIRGFHFSYKQGKTTGAADVFAALRSDTNDYWQVVCAVHEIVP